MDELLHNTTFWVAVSFVIFVVLAVWKGRGKVSDAIDTRIDRIRQEIDQAENLKEEAQARLAELKRKQSDAEKQAEDIVENAKAEAKILKSDAETRFKETTARREQQAKDKIGQIEADAIAEVRSYAVDMAISASTEVLSKQMEGKGGDKAVENAIEAIPQKLH